MRIYEVYGASAWAGVNELGGICDEFVEIRVRGFWEGRGLNWEATLCKFMLCCRRRENGQSGCPRDRKAARKTDVFRHLPPWNFASCSDLPYMSLLSLYA